jgi:RHS repeat-associated protein
VADDLSALAFTYDARNRVETVDNAGTPNVPNVVLAYTYDGVGNVLSVTDTIDGSSGATTSYAYDGFNRTTVITQAGPAVAEKRVDFGYNELGQFALIERFTDLGGTQVVVASSYLYDSLNRLQSLTHSNASDTVAFYNFTYDAASRITQIADVDGLTNYSYDARSQLTGAERADADLRGDEAYEYDANGNRVSSSLHDDDYVTGLANRLLSDGTYNYEYDDEGNMIRRTEIATGDFREFEYDHRNRLVAVIDKDASETIVQEVRFTYDVLGRRISKSVDQDPTDAIDAALSHFVYDREDVILDFIDPDGASPESAPPTLDKRYLHGPAIDQVLAQEESGGEVYWHLTDHLGTVRDMVDDDGNVANHLIYDSFGNVVDESSPVVDTRYQFTGREFVEEIGVYYYRARFYDSSIGRFLSADPTDFAGGDANLYRYTTNSPVVYSDPFGLDNCLGCATVGRRVSPEESLLDDVKSSRTNQHSPIPIEDLPGYIPPTDNRPLGSPPSEPLDKQAIYALVTIVSTPFIDGFAERNPLVGGLLKRFLGLLTLKDLLGAFTDEVEQLDPRSCPSDP